MHAQNWHGTLEESLSILVDTGGDDVHHPYSAFNQGYDAAMEHGLMRDLNPYPEGSEREWWFEGWDEATDQMEEFDDE